MIGISLNQGKQFKNYQTKFKKRNYKDKNIKEGFVTADQEILLRPKEDGYTSVIQNQNDTQNQTTNQKDLTELQQFCSSQINKIFALISIRSGYNKVLS